MPKISIIIPVFNVEKYLSRALEAVISQTFSDLEILLVDDGSTDRSGEICDSFAKKDARIKVIHKQNGGISSARNAALRICTGEYIGFVDSDDYVDKDYFEKLICAIEKNKADIAVAALASDTGLSVVKNKIASGVITGNHNIFESYLKSPEINHTVYNKIYKSELLSEIRFPENIKRTEDVWFTATVLTKVSKAVFVPDCYYYIFYRRNSLERSDFCEKDLFLLEVTDYLQKLIKDKYSDLYHYVAYLMVDNILSLKKRILLQHSLKRNKAFYSDLSVRFNKELENLPQEYKSGKAYETYLSATHGETLFKIKYGLIGYKSGIKQIIKRVLIWIK